MHYNKATLALFALSAIGLALALIYLRESPLPVLIWNAGPYILVWLLVPLVKDHLVILIGVTAMLIVDLWLYAETFIQSKSSILLAVSLLSTLKVLTVFPLGLLLGYWLRRRSKVEQRG